MIKQVSLFFVLLVAASVFGEWGGDPGLRVRFGIGLSGYFMSMPRTVAEAKTSRWEQVARPDGPLSSLVMYCTADLLCCAIFDDIDYIAGVQVAIPQANFTNATWDWETRGYTSWTPSGSNNTYWTIQQYFINETMLATDADEREAALNGNKTLQYGKVWLTGIDGELFELPTVKDDIAETIYTEQACIPFMGHHYFYNMSADTECTAEDIYPWFALVASDELIGTGMIVAGLLPEDSLETDYFERPGQTAVELIVPNGPQCLYDLADDPGFLTIHIYYINNPLLITCINQ